MKLIFLKAKLFVMRFWYIIVIAAALLFLVVVLIIKPIAAPRKTIYKRKSKRKASGRIKTRTSSGGKTTKTKSRGAKGVLRVGNKTFPNTIQGRKDWSAAMRRRRAKAA